MIRTMAEVKAADSSPEPSMEEILASIRKIISDEKDSAIPLGAANSNADDVLELTQIVHDDDEAEEVAAVAAEPAPAVAVDPPLEPQEPDEPIAAPVVAAPPSVEAGMSAVSFPDAVQDSDDLVSDNVAKAATSSLAALANTVQMERLAAIAPAMSPIGNGSLTLEEMVTELMRPMIKAWLDQNLPAMVERIVQKEVERIAKRVPE